MVIYFIFLFVLFILWILFVYNLNITIEFSLNNLIIRVFKIPFVNIKGEKFKKFIMKFIPTSKSQLQEEIDLSSLFELIHYDLIEIKFETNINDYSRVVIINSLIEIIYSFIEERIKNHIENYTFLIVKSMQNNINGIIKCNFNIGILLINYIDIKRRYRNEKTS